jgi:hypothetical protein
MLLVVSAILPNIGGKIAPPTKAKHYFVFKISLAQPGKPGWLGTERLLYD